MDLPIPSTVKAKLQGQAPVHVVGIVQQILGAVQVVVQIAMVGFQVQIVTVVVVGSLQVLTLAHLVVVGVVVVEIDILMIYYIKINSKRSFYE